jgi:hypothetical protein
MKPKKWVNSYQEKAPQFRENLQFMTLKGLSLKMTLAIIGPANSRKIQLLPEPTLGRFSNMYLDSTSFFAISRKIKCGKAFNFSILKITKGVFLCRVFY